MSTKRARREPELHEMNPTLRFSDRAADYVRYRPDYPAAAIDAILEGLATPVVAADVGAGTGISARLLADRGVRVIAIEPNAEMRAAAGDDPRIEWRDGTAEATGLADSSVDLVLSAQAFHWFREQPALAEFARILRTRGRLALMWNNRDDEDPLTRGYIEAIRAVSGEHPAEMREFDPGVISVSGRFAPPRVETFPHAQTLDRDGLIGRAASASYVPKSGQPFERLIGLLDHLFNRYRDARGIVVLRYVTHVYLAERR
ncbi:MAG TPA: class I SAM-dependent methyltransferase [Candidatus Udaeobacter sp.]|jgi:SAM-dependent methyltransferase|nr:class I SAM-dependent methyltransferase [Candidatus Udaeobacter sp.]